MRTSLPSTARRAAALVVALVSVPGCATKGDLRDVRDEIRSLAVRQDSVLSTLNRQTRMTQDTLRSASDQLFEIRGSVSRQLAEILEELSTLRELTGQNQRAIAAIRDQLEGLRRSAVLGTPAGDVAGQVPGGATAPYEMYNAAVSQYNRGSFTAARMAFEQFLQAYPSDELAPEARYKLADMLVQEGRREDAVRAFQQIPELHPEAPKVPDALYRVGLLQLEMGNRDEGRRTLERVVNTWPEDPVADLAREAIRGIRR